MKEKLEQYGFGFNHAALITVVSLGLFSLAYAKSDISVKAMFAKAEKNEMVTYEQVRDEVYAQAGLINNEDEYLKGLQDQFAVLDKGNIDGKVLGEAIGMGEIPQAKDLRLPELEQMYPVRLAETQTKESIEIYLNKIKELEVKYETISLFAVLNSDDKELLTRAAGQWRLLLSELSGLSAPKAMTQYQKAKLGYYYSALKMSEVYAGKVNESELQTYFQALMSYGNALTQLEQKNQ